MQKIITLANRKGGTGRTTSSFNLGYTYAMQGKKVCYIDLDSQKNLSQLFGISDSALDDFKAVKVMPINAFIDILPATSHFAILENEINNLFDRNIYIRDNIISKITGYDYVIIDTSPSLSILNINAFCASDVVHIVVNPDRFSLQGLTEMKQIMEQVKSVNPNLKYNIVLNGYTTGRNLTEAVTEALAAEPNYTGIEIPERQHIKDSIAEGKPAISKEDIYKPFEALAALV